MSDLSEATPTEGGVNTSPPAIDDSQTPTDLGGKAARGGAVVFASVVAGRFISLGITAVLARLLSPSDFGLLGMVFTLTALLSVFSDMGLATATIQKSRLDHNEASAAFWLNLVFATVLGGLTAAAAPLLAWFYEQPALSHLTLWCAIGFPITAMGTQHIAQLSRRLEFSRVATCELASSLVGGIAGIFMAWRGFGVYALVGQLLASSATNSVLAWLVSGFVPSYPRHTAEFRSMLKFGGYLTAFNMVNYFARNLDNVLVGRFWGASPLGLYTRAYSLMLYPIALVSGPVARVTIPTLSRLQNDLPRMRAAYLRVLQLIAFCTFPMMGFLLVASPDVILVVYGRNWTGAIPIFRVLCIAGFFQGIYNATGQIFIAAGRTDRMFRCGILLTAALVIAFGIGVKFSPVGVAVGYAVVMTVALLPYLSYTYATINMRLSDVLTALAPSFVAAVIACLAAWLLGQAMPADWPAPARLAITGAILFLTYLGSTLLLCRSLMFDMLERTVWKLLPNYRALPISSSTI